MTPYPPDRRSFLAMGAGLAAGLVLKPSLLPAEDVAELTLKRASTLLRSKSVSPLELTEACLERIEKYNPSLNAFITITADEARAAAKRMQEEQRRGVWRGALHGIPVAVKDNIDTAGTRTTAASELFKDRVPADDAYVVRRLRDAGAILLGKTNLHEFAYGGSATVSYFNPMHNPWALERISGGSSGGSAIAAAAGLCFGALATDTAGSVRIPASYCGVVGFKLTYGRVSNRGVIPLSWTLDHVGPICRTVEDAALMLGAIAGYDESDPTTTDIEVPDYSRAFRMETSKLRLGVPRAFFFDGLDEEVSKSVDAAMKLLSKRVASIEDILLPATPLPFGEIYGRVRGIEAYAYHSPWVRQSPEKYQAVTRQRILQGATVTSVGYVEARREVDRLRREIKKTFAKIDLLITPTMAVPPVLITQGDDPTAASPRNTLPFDILGLPTISVPCGFTTAGLPIGLQISGAPFAESKVLLLAHAYEQSTDWHRRHPKVDPA